MNITYYPGELLGDYKVQAENCTLGTQELYLGSPTSANSPMWNAKQIPTFTRGFDGAFNAFGPGQWAADLHETFSNDSGWHMFGVVPEGFPGIVSSEVFDYTQPTTKNLKCRGMATKMTQLIIEALGFDYVEMSWSEIHSALMLGTIDAAFGTTGADDYFLFMDVADYAYKYETHFGQIYMFINMDLYNGLDSEDRALLDRISDEWIVDVWVQWKAYEDAKWDELKDLGTIELILLTDEEWKNNARSIRESTWPELEAMVGPDIMKIVRASSISVD
jgi:TRAP-type C4-dicarboxylate transport system substrate-binding protein